MFKLNDRVQRYSGNVGEIVIINDDDCVIAWNDYEEGLSTSDEYDEYLLPCYDDRFYGTYDKYGLEKYEIKLYTIEKEIEDIDNEIKLLQQRRTELLNQNK